MEKRKRGQVRDDHEVIPNLEMVDWVDDEHCLHSIMKKHGVRRKMNHQTFAELLEDIRKNGNISMTTPFADLLIFEPTGRFEGCVIAARTSGINIRRFLIRPETFDQMSLSVQNLIDHLLSNNSVECEVELQHLRDFSEAVEADEVISEDDQVQTRLKIDIIAANQIMQLYEETYDSSDSETHFIFSAGFSVGRIFSAIQNLASLERKAFDADRYRKKYEERGKKGKSDTRKKDRLLHLLGHMESLHRENPAFARLPPNSLGEIALQDATTENPKLWSQGRGQLESYLTTLASDPEYKSRYDALFFKTA